MGKYSGKRDELELKFPKPCGWRRMGCVSSLFPLTLSLSLSLVIVIVLVVVVVAIVAFNVDSTHTLRRRCVSVNLRRQQKAPTAPKKGENPTHPHTESDTLGCAARKAYTQRRRAQWTTSTPNLALCPPPSTATTCKFVHLYIYLSFYLSPLRRRPHPNFPFFLPVLLVFLHNKFFWCRDDMEKMR